MEKDRSIQTSQSILVNAVGRARNTGMQFSIGGRRVIDAGDGPVELQSIVATITLSRPGDPTVRVLDTDGRRTSQTLPVANGRFTIDGAKHKTIYYEVVYE